MKIIFCILMILAVLNLINANIPGAIIFVALAGIVHYLKSKRDSNNR